MNPPDDSSIDDPEVDRGHRVTPLELSFDLVSVFAITQLTGFLADHPTWEAYEAIRYREDRAWIRSRRGTFTWKRRRGQDVRGGTPDGGVRD